MKGLSVMLFAFLAAAGSATAGTIYVDSQNSGTQNGNSPATAYKTIQQAANVAVAGDVVRIKGYNTYYVYNEVVKPVNGGTSNSNRITYTKYLNNNDDVVIDSNGKSGQKGVFDIRKHYITLDGLTITDSDNPGNTTINYGVHVQNAHHVEIKNCEIYRTTSAGIITWDADDIYIYNNLLRDVTRSGNQEGISIRLTDGFTIKDNEIKENWGEGIDIKVGSKNGTVERNYVHDAVDKTIPFPVGTSSRYDPPGIYVDSWNLHQSNISVKDNVVHDQRHGLALSIEQPGGSHSNIRFYNNIVYDVDINAFTIGVWKGTGGANGVTVEHNYLFNKSEFQNVIGVNQSQSAINTMQNFVFQNNILGSAAPEDGPYGANQFFVRHPHTFTIQYNFYRTEGSGTTAHGNRPGQLGSYYQRGPIGLQNPTGTRLVGPWLVDDVTLSSQSLGVDNGTASITMYVDIDNTYRPQGAGYDIGPYEQ